MVTDECEAPYELKNTIEMLFVWLTFIRDYWKNNRRLDPVSGHSLMYIAPVLMWKTTVYSGIRVMLKISSKLFFITL